MAGRSPFCLFDALHVFLSESEREKASHAYADRIQIVVVSENLLEFIVLLGCMEWEAY
jgi:hypothetical protein